MQVCLPNSWSREVPGHTCGGEQVFTTGYMDYKEKIKKTMDELDYINDPEALNKCEGTQSYGYRLRCSDHPWRALSQTGP